MKRKVVSLFLALMLSVGFVAGSAQIVNTGPVAGDGIVCVVPFGTPSLGNPYGD